MNTCALLRLVLILCLAPGLRAEVLEVPGVFGSVQAAVDAAVAGDVVVVAPGASAESVVVDGKGIILVGDGDMLKLVRLMVTNVPAGQIAVIRNVSVPHVGYTPTLSGEALRLVDNVGSVWVEDCSFRGMHGFEGTATTADPPVNGAPGAVVMGCKDVALLRSQFVGGAGAAFFPARDPLSATSGGPGLSITDSRVAVDGGLTRGNDGGDGQVLGAVNGGHGGLGIDVWNSQLVAAGVTIDGGDGGIGSGSGGNGGDGVMLNDAISSCSLRDTTYVTGSGAAGQVGDGLDGQHALNSGGAPIQFFSEPHRSLSSSQAPVRPGDVYTLDYELQAGDLAVVFVAHLPIHELLPNLRGVLFVSPPFLIAVPLPAGVGPQSLALTTPPMPPALDHYEVYVQLIASAGAGLLLGPGTVLSAVP